VLVVVTGPKTSTGTTTTAAALALRWPRPVVLVDCDPAGGDVVPGLLPGRAPADRGLLSWAAQSRGLPAVAAARLFQQAAVGLPERADLWLVPGFTARPQARSFTAETWELLASALEVSSEALGMDSLVDVGRLVHEEVVAWPLLLAANQIVLTVRRTVRSVHAAQVALTLMRTRMPVDTVGLLVIVGDGPYSAEEIAATLGLPLAGTVPEDRRTAAVLSEGAAAGERALRRAPLLRGADKVAAFLVRNGELQREQAKGVATP